MYLNVKPEDCVVVVDAFTDKKYCVQKSQWESGEGYLSMYSLRGKRLFITKRGGFHANGTGYGAILSRQRVKSVNGIIVPGFDELNIIKSS